MQERVKIPLSKVALEALAAKEEETALIFWNELQAHKANLEQFLLGYYYHKRQRVLQLQIERPVLTNNSAGFVVLNYVLGHFNACADIDTAEKAQMVVQLELDYTTGALQLVGEFFYEREPDEF